MVDSKIQTECPINRIWCNRFWTSNWILRRKGKTKRLKIKLPHTAICNVEKFPLKISTDQKHPQVSEVPQLSNKSMPRLQVPTRFNPMAITAPLFPPNNKPKLLSQAKRIKMIDTKDNYAEVLIQIHQVKKLNKVLQTTLENRFTNIDHTHRIN